MQGSANKYFSKHEFAFLSVLLLLPLLLLLMMMMTVVIVRVWGCTEHASVSIPLFLPLVLTCISSVIEHATVIAEQCESDTCEILCVGILVFSERGRESAECFHSNGLIASTDLSSAC